MSKKKNESKKDAIDWLDRDNVTLYGSPKDLEPRKPKFRFPWQKEPKKEPSPWRLEDLDAWDPNEPVKDT